MPVDPLLALVAEYNQAALLTAAALCGVVVAVRDRRHPASTTPVSANASADLAGAGS